MWLVPSDDVRVLETQETMMIQHFMIDPPWSQKKGGLRKARPNQDRSLEYTTLTVDDIFALLDTQVFTLAAPTHNVFLWGIDKFLHEGEQRMIERGYKRHARLVWDKENGVAPAFTIRYTHEYLSWFYKPTLQKVAPDQRGKLSTVLRERSRSHSRKPNAAYTLVETLYPDQPRMDVFSREARAGWSQFGDQPTHFTGG